MNVNFLCNLNFYLEVIFMFPRSLDHFYIATRYIKMDKTFGTYSTIEMSKQFFLLKSEYLVVKLNKFN